MRSDSGYVKFPVPHLANIHQAKVVSDDANGTVVCQILATDVNKIYLEDLDVQAEKDKDMWTWAQWLGE